MAQEYKLPYTGAQVQERLAKVDEISAPDDVTISKNADGDLAVKDAGITTEKIADGAVSVAKLESVQAIKEEMGLGDISSITYGTESLTAGSSALETGKLYLVYE